ncbi:MAG: DAK2 domain-containing protein [Firmicutes bacterium]|nr:DAK2 domain-containing protein [Bacillota bacterium]HBG09918.1 dihydroxyacetone kinase [Bacillota bacterium]
MDVINGLAFKNMLLVAARHLDQQKDTVNALNVFPVPDGDTGTNMSLTLNSAIKELEQAGSGEIKRLASLLTRGSLMGARGNSGVILSQFFRGFSDGLAHVQTEISGEDLAHALVMASQTTYRAVMRPVEGTMLTVARVAAEHAVQASEGGAGAEEVLRAALEGARTALADTPNILPVLKQAGVVDAGGQGLVCLFEGFVMGLTATPEELEQLLVAAVPEKKAEAAAPKLEQEVVVNKYCTEFIILGSGIDAVKIRGELEQKGDSLLVVSDGDVVKVHVHTDHPGQVLEFCGQFGDLTEIAIDNMRLQNQEFASHEESHRLDYSAGNNVVDFPGNSVDGEPKPLGIVAVVPGEGLAEIFKSLGVDYVVAGGQTMNPSTEDLVRAVDSVNAEAVIILPNNKNVIFSAQQARELTEKTVGVVPTRSVPQGISALMYFVAEDPLEENLAAMEEGMREVKTGEVTYAVRSTVAGDLHIEERDIIGLAEGKIAVVGSTPTAVAQDLVRTMVDEDSSVISIYYGSDLDDQAAQELHELISTEFPDCEVEVYPGGQPLYYYIVSVE